MTEDNVLRIVGGPDEKTCSVAVSGQGSGRVRVELKVGGDRIASVGSDAFEAFDEIRFYLEPRLICCAGTSLDVYPSGMSRDAGAGEIASRLLPHRLSAGTVEVFSATTDWTPATVEEQRLFFALWWDDLIPPSWWDVRDDSWAVNQALARKPFEQADPTGQVQLITMELPDLLMKPGKRTALAKKAAARRAAGTKPAPRKVAPSPTIPKTQSRGLKKAVARKPNPPAQ